MRIFFIFKGILPTKVNIIGGLIFRGKRPARAMGAYFQRGLIFEGGLLFRVYSNSSRYMYEIWHRS